jgi:hypothetical protein
MILVVCDFVQYYDPKWNTGTEVSPVEAWAFWRSGRSGRSGREWAYYKHKAF